MNSEIKIYVIVPDTDGQRKTESPHLWNFQKEEWTKRNCLIVHI